MSLEGLLFSEEIWGGSGEKRRWGERLQERKPRSGCNIWKKNFLKILFSKFLDFNTFRSDSVLSNKISNKILIVTGKLSQWLPPNLCRMVCVQCRHNEEEVNSVMKFIGLFSYWIETLDFVLLCGNMENDTNCGCFLTMRWTSQWPCQQTKDDIRNMEEKDT